MNDTVVQTVVDGLPFGGIGPSGSGYHTGKFSFDMFTHLRSTLDSPSFMERFLWMRYPPYNAKKRQWYIRLVFPTLPARTAAGGYAGWGPWFVAGVVAMTSTVLLTGRLRLGSS